MRAVAHVQATYKVSDNDTRGIFVDIANLVFGQHWEQDSVFDDDHAGDDSDSNEYYSESTDDKDEWKPSEDIETVDTVMEAEGSKKKRKVQSDLTYKFPSRATLRRWMESASLLNLRYVAKILMDHDSVTTVGFDDTTKANGHRLLDSKALNITVDGEGKQRKSYTTGFHPNLSHSGED